MKHRNTPRDKMFLYDQTAHVYNHRYREIQEEKYRSILRRVTFRRADLILDAGCGTGMLLEKIPKEHAVGVDFSREMIKRAKNKNKSSNLVRADLSNLPFKDNTFSKVLGVTILQNVEHPLKAVREIRRVTKKKGLTILSTLKKKTTKEEIRKLIRNAQLKEKEVYKISEDIVIISQKN
nr:class I SAM-dependent methyltransferase [Candidatus Freyarchaeota archaeon]